MLVSGILLAVYDLSVLPYTKCTVMEETAVKDGRVFCFFFLFFPTDNIYIWIDQTASLEM